LFGTATHSGFLLVLEPG